MTQIIQHSKSSNLTGQDAETGTDLAINANLLIKRLTALIGHVGKLSGDETAESHAREISMHLKNIKEIHAYYTAVKETEPEGKPKYTREEEEALAEELAAMIFKHGGIT